MPTSKSPSSGNANPIGIEYEKLPTPISIENTNSLSIANKTCEEFARPSVLPVTSPCINSTGSLISILIFSIQPSWIKIFKSTFSPITGNNSPELID